MSVLFSTERPDWETPQALFDALNVEFRFETDVCATAENAKVPNFFSPEKDGLIQPWRGTCWMNPPYGRRETGKWIAKAYGASRYYAATVVCLVPARTDTRWWHEYVMRASEIRFVRGRVRFVGATNDAPFSPVVVVFEFGRGVPKISSYTLPGGQVIFATAPVGGAPE